MTPSYKSGQHQGFNKRYYLPQLDLDLDVLQLNENKSEIVLFDPPKSIQWTHNNLGNLSV